MGEIRREDFRSDEVGGRLWALGDELAERYGSAVKVERSVGDGGFWTDVRPARADALGVGWIDWESDEMQMQTTSGLGGRWELDRSVESVEFIELTVRAIAAGRVVEVFGPLRRSRVRVWLEDGSVAEETGYDGLGAFVPLPFWTRWGRHVTYRPYA